MKKLYFLLATLFISNGIFAQAPYIGDGSGEGLGQYGYLEKDALTFARLYRNTYNNIQYLAARFWVQNGAGPGVEGIYYTNHDGSTWQCSGDNVASKTTQNYNPADFGSQWAAGANVYVSVRSGYCGGATGGPFNERQFQIFDFNVVPVPSSHGIFDANGDCAAVSNGGSNVVASFTINVGSLSGKELDRFFFTNTGTYAEGVQIPNDGFKLFYEAATGSESFNGSESSVSLYGDWGGNSTTNNVYGADNMNIPLSGTVRFYVVLCNLIDGSFSENSNAVALTLLNDGISLGPTLDGKSLARIAETSLSSNLPLPVKLIEFSAKEGAEATVNLNWTTAEEVDNSYFEVQRSQDAQYFNTIGKIAGKGTTNDVSEYSFQDNTPTVGANYYRLKQVDFSGKTTFSSIVSAFIGAKPTAISIYPNPAADKLHIADFEQIERLEIWGSDGKLKQSEQNIEADVLLKKLQPGTYLIKIIKTDGQQTSQRFIKL